MKPPENYNYVKAIVISSSFDFLSSRANAECLNSSSHMNAFGNSVENQVLDTVNPCWNPDNKGKPAPELNMDDVKLIVAAAVSECDVRGKTNLDVIYGIERGVRKVLPDIYKYCDNKDISLDRDTVDALYVELINYIGLNVGIDYGIYTRDLRVPNTDLDK